MQSLNLPGGVRLRRKWRTFTGGVGQRVSKLVARTPMSFAILRRTSVWRRVSLFSVSLWRLPSRVELSMIRATSVIGFVLGGHAHVVASTYWLALLLSLHEWRRLTLFLAFQASAVGKIEQRPLWHHTQLVFKRTRTSTNCRFEKSDLFNKCTS